MTTPAEEKLHDYRFEGPLDSDSRVYEAWRTAMDVRKFEIELYWKRGAYFWTFIGVALAAYGALLAAKDMEAETRSDALFAVACLGLVFAFAWYLVNRASKFWQRNWEYQVDVLEDAAIGPLYKTVFSKSGGRLFDLTDAYPFSVSNINQLLSLFVVSVFVLLIIYANPCFGAACDLSVPKASMLAFSLAWMGILLWWGLTSSERGKRRKSPSTPLRIQFSKRELAHDGEIDLPARRAPTEVTGADAETAPAAAPSGWLQRLCRALLGDDRR